MTRTALVVRGGWDGHRPVEATELSNGKLNEGLGKITWTYIIPPQQQKEFDLQYEVKYPKREHVVLE